MSIPKHMHVSGEPRRFDVFTGGGRRRRFSASEKAAIVEESYADGVSVCGVARRHGLTSQQLFGWRRLARLGLSRSAERPLFVPVVVTPEPEAPPSDELSTTGYAVNALPTRFAEVPRCDKPVDVGRLVGKLILSCGAGRQGEGKYGRGLP